MHSPERIITGAEADRMRMERFMRGEEQRMLTHDPKWGWPRYRHETEEEREEREFQRDLGRAQREMRKSAPEGTMFVEDFAAGMARGLEAGLSPLEAFFGLVGAEVVTVEAEDDAEA